MQMIKHVNCRWHRCHMCVRWDRRRQWREAWVINGMVIEWFVMQQKDWPREQCGREGHGHGWYAWSGHYWIRKQPNQNGQIRGRRWPGIGQLELWQGQGGWKPSLKQSHNDLRDLRNRREWSCHKQGLCGEVKCMHNGWRSLWQSTRLRKEEPQRARTTIGCKGYVMTWEACKGYTQQQVKRLQGGSVQRLEELMKGMRNNRRNNRLSSQRVGVQRLEELAKGTPNNRRDNRLSSQRISAQRLEELAKGTRNNRHNSRSSSQGVSAQRLEKLAKIVQRFEELKEYARQQAQQQVKLTCAS